MYNTLSHSINLHASAPVSITALNLDQLHKLCGFNRFGLTPFTFTRFLVPYLCNYEGWALFLDADILLRADIKSLFDMARDEYAIMVSKNEHRFEWASVMLFNNDKCRVLTPEYVNDPKVGGLHTIEWVKEEEIGDLPREWNHLVGYDKPRDDAKLVHFTQASPANIEGSMCEYADEWKKYAKHMNSTASWFELMGNSRHAKEVNGVRVPLYLEGDMLLSYLDFHKALQNEKKESVIQIAS